MRYITAIIALLIVGGLGYFLGQRGQALRQSSPSQESARESRSQDSSSQPPVKTVIGLGKLLPHGGLVNLLAPPGERVHYVQPIQVGDEVQKGQPLFHLQSRSIRKKDLELAEARRADTLRAAELEQSTLRLKQELAEASLAEALDGLKHVEMEQPQVQLLKDQLAAATEVLKRTEALRADPDTAELVGLHELEKQRLTVEQLRVQLNQAQTRLQMGRERAERAVQVAQAQLKAAKAAVDQADQMVPLQSLNAAVELARNAYEQTEVCSPIDGRVLDILVADGDTATNRPVLVIGDTSQMDCVAEVNDSLLNRIDVDKYGNALRARITSDALPGPLWGAVERKGVMIGPRSLADPNPFARVDRRVGTVVIHLDQPQIAARAVNLQVDVEIETRPGQIQESENPAAMSPVESDEAIESEAAEAANSGST